MVPHEDVRSGRNERDIYGRKPEGAGGICVLLSQGSFLYETLDLGRTEVVLSLRIN